MSDMTSDDGKAGDGSRHGKPPARKPARTPKGGPSKRGPGKSASSATGRPRPWGPARGPKRPPATPRDTPPPRTEPAGLGARRLAVYLIEAVLTRGRALEDALESADADPRLATLEPRDRGLARLIAATVLRRRGTLEAVLARFLQHPLPSEAARARAILLAGAAQILFTGTPPHAAINLAVEQCRHDRAAGRYAKLANAVLRRVSVEGAECLAGLERDRLDIPAWMLARWTAAYGPEAARAIAVASLAEAPLDLSLKSPASAPEWAARLGGALLATGSVRLAEHGRIEDLPGFTEGEWWVQDAAAALPARLLGPVEGWAIADLCAAPGGKTAELAAAGALVTAVDASEARLRRLRENMARLGLADRVEVVEADAGAWQPERLFDAVLVDAPCTATGTIRRHPDILHLKRPDDAEKLAAIQLRLLSHAATLVKPGGLLVYCVCSLEPEEGPGVVAAFLAADAGFARLPVEAATQGWPPGWITPAGDLRTLPSEAPPLAASGNAEGGTADGGMDGFYAVRLRRAEAVDGA